MLYDYMKFLREYPEASYCQLYDWHRMNYKKKFKYQNRFENRASFLYNFLLNASVEISKLFPMDFFLVPVILFASSLYFPEPLMARDIYF